MNATPNDSQLIRLGISITAWIIVAAIPVLLVGLSFEDTATQWVKSLANHPAKLLWVSFLLLTSDIVLPIPSSFVCTLCGQSVPWLLSAIVCGAGLFSGSMIGFALSRTWGRRLAERFSSVEQIELLDQKIRVAGVWWLILLRPLPILAEAAVLLCGVHRLSWLQFIGAASASSFVTAIAFSVLGTLSQQGPWTSFAWCISIMVPLTGLMICKYLFRQRQTL